MFSMTVPPQVSAVLDRLNDGGFEAYLVGGCVRDALMGREPHDFDVTTSALPKETSKVFRKMPVIKTGIKHGTVMVLSQKMPVEVTTFRADGEYLDNRRPESVTFVPDLESDLGRRDFTVNAMAWSRERGVVDLFGGREDLKNGIIRCVGDPEKRFNEDGLRIMRALRFASRLGFEIEPATAAAIHAQSYLLKNISAERLFIELKGLLMGDGVERVLNEFSDVLFRFLPELAPMADTPQYNPHHFLDVWRHTSMSVGAAKQDHITRLTMLFHDSGKPVCHTVDANGIDHFHGHPKASAEIAETCLTRLKSDKRTKNAVILLTKKHDMFFPKSERRVRRAIAEIGEDNFLRLMDVKRADAAAHVPESRDGLLREVERVEEIYLTMKRENACMSIKELAVNGRDLISIGAKKGEQVGNLLAMLFDKACIGELANDREILLTAAKKIIENNSLK